jgi:hypothetical protein
MFARNSMSKPAQFCFAADLFMLQAILRSEEQGGKSWLLEYVFPRNCYLQVIEWILNNASQIGAAPFVGVTSDADSTEVRVTFPNEVEQDKMHKFFEMFNQKRRQAQGVDSSFPPLPDIYQGNSKPVTHVIQRYLVLISEAFDGESNHIEIPIGPNGAELSFRCC